MTANPIYYHFKSSEQHLASDCCTQAGQTNYLYLNSSDTELASSKRNQVDYSVNRNWKERAKEIALITAKVIIFPWGICSVGKWLVERVVMSIIYPAQSIIAGKTVQESDKSRIAVTKELKEKGYIVRHVILEKNGIQYSGLMIGHNDTIDNGQWVLHATGQYGLIEEVASIAETFHFSKFNTLLINGPNVGRSKGHAIPETIGDAQEIGILFLENAIKAKKIVLSGFSFGGGAIGLAIQKHIYKPGIEYSVVFDKTFSRISDIARSMLNAFKHLPQEADEIIKSDQRLRFLWWIGQPLIEWFINKNMIKTFGLEIDTVAASDRLVAENILQIIIQGGGKSGYSTKKPEENNFEDGTIPANASLLSKVNPENAPTPYRYFKFHNKKHNKLYNPFAATQKTAKDCQDLILFIGNINIYLDPAVQYHLNETLNLYEQAIEIKSWIASHKELIEKYYNNLIMFVDELNKQLPPLDRYKKKEHLDIYKQTIDIMSWLNKDNLITKRFCHDCIQLAEHLNIFLPPKDQYTQPNSELSLIEQALKAISWINKEKKGSLISNFSKCIDSLINFIDQMNVLIGTAPLIRFTTETYLQKSLITELWLSTYKVSTRCTAYFENLVIFYNSINFKTLLPDYHYIPNGTASAEKAFQIILFFEKNKDQSEILNYSTKCIQFIEQAQKDLRLEVAYDSDIKSYVDVNSTLQPLAV